jgi:hypothetical protein
MNSQAKMAIQVREIATYTQLSTEHSNLLISIAEYLDSFTGLEYHLRYLHEKASYSLVNDELTENEKGHRMGTLDVCEAMLKLF